MIIHTVSMHFVLQGDGHDLVGEVAKEVSVVRARFENQFPRFTYPSFRGDLCDLAENGSEIYLSFEKRKQYVDLVRDFRFGEMSCQSRMLNVRAGLATIAPINILTRLFKPEEVELKICGQHKIDIEVLKKHTIYQVGLTQSDQHIKVNS